MLYRFFLFFEKNMTNTAYSVGYHFVSRLFPLAIGPLNLFSAPYHCEWAFCIILVWRSYFFACLQAVDLEQPIFLAMV